jgi:hypothetical protein
MKLSEGAIECLSLGARSDCLDTNAITPGNKQSTYYACQFIWEEEQFLPLRQPLPEFQPILEVKHIHWLGTQRGVPLIRLVVTDGIHCMEMRPSLRTEYVQRRNFKKNGHLFRGKLNIGKRFTLLEYTTDVTVCPKSNKITPTIFFEEIRAEPQKKNMKSANRDHAKQMNRKDAVVTQAEEDKENTLSFEQAVKEMDCQLQRLKIHRSRLGY